MNEAHRYRELITFCNVLSVSLRSGRPIPDSMQALTEKNHSSQASIWCQSLAQKLADGYSAEEACRDLAGFDKVLARLMPLLGEKKLIKVLEIYTAFLVNMAILREQLTAALFYPMIVMGLLVLNLFHLNFVLFPNIYAQVLETGKTIPLMMHLLYFTKLACWPLALIIPAFILLAFVEMLRVSLTAKVCGNSIIARLFGASQAIRLQETSRLQGIISLYLQSGFSLEEAIATAAEFAAGDEKEALSNVAADIGHGVDPSFAFSLSPVLADVHWSKTNAESLPENLQYLSDSNNRRSTAILKSFSRQMLILALLLTGLFVAMIAFGFFDSYYWVIWSFA